MHGTTSNVRNEEVTQSQVFVGRDEDETQRGHLAI